ncbi:hypothetical protein A7K61_18605 [Pseudomonas sp. AP42]|nr:hypothetical protein A7K61_18605 [Pseudomonas sp. AP42]
MEQLALIPTVIAVTLQAADQVIGRVIVKVFLLGGRQLRGLAVWLKGTDLFDRFKLNNLPTFCSF